MIAIEVAQVCRNFKEKLNILANCVEQKVIKIWSIFFPRHCHFAHKSDYLVDKWKVKKAINLVFFFQLRNKKWDGEDLLSLNLSKTWSSPDLVKLLSSVRIILTQAPDIFIAFIKEMKHFLIR